MVCWDVCYVAWTWVSNVNPLKVSKMSLKDHYILLNLLLLGHPFKERKEILWKNLVSCLFLVVLDWKKSQDFWIKGRTLSNLFLIVFFSLLYFGCKMDALFPPIAFFLHCGSSRSVSLIILFIYLFKFHTSTKLFLIKKSSNEKIIVVCFFFSLRYSGFEYKFVVLWIVHWSWSTYDSVITFIFLWFTDCHSLIGSYH